MKILPIHNVGQNLPYKFYELHVSTILSLTFLHVGLLPILLFLLLKVFITMGYSQLYHLVGNQTVATVTLIVLPTVMAHCILVLQGLTRQNLFVTATFANIENTTSKSKNTKKKYIY